MWRQFSSRVNTAFKSNLLAANTLSSGGKYSKNMLQMCKFFFITSIFNFLVRPADVGGLSAAEKRKEKI
jgi:hypothetical protein